MALPDDLDHEKLAPRYLYRLFGKEE